ncbi:BMP family ABC transporter substrate-binding protein [Nesterenkonia sp.]|uniref:BMP family lipoprotein n=1 Tax=Nesterenkonia sp. TaxID=704201 RepID=UPI002633B8A1|nr:BMP family ABC transporter substrate-binding protein [Nesterenkonia sp.]
MRSTPSRAGVALAGVAALALSACGEAPDEESNDAAAGGENSDYTACVVSDEGGWNDQSFNQSAHEGLMAAVEDFDVDHAEAESSSESDFVPNVDSMVQQGCDITFGVGYLLADAINDAALENEDLTFGLIDEWLPDEPENAKSLVFNTSEAAYLAGYLAAAMSETGTVGTWGGLQIPSVTVFMDGFADGVERYNADNDDDVELVGWDKDAQDGSFAGSFDDQNAGRTLTEQLLAQDADIIMPVAGNAGIGGAAAIEQDGEALMIWVDSDGYESTDYGSIILTSVLKEISQAVYDTIEEGVNGEFSSEPYIGDLENDGVGLAPFHDYEDEVPEEVKEKLEQLREEIISGETPVESENAP